MLRAFRDIVHIKALNTLFGRSKDISDQPVFWNPFWRGRWTRYAHVVDVHGDFLGRRLQVPAPSTHKVWHHGFYTTHKKGRRKEGWGIEALFFHIRSYNILIQFWYLVAFLRIASLYKSLNGLLEVKLWMFFVLSLLGPSLVRIPFISRALVVPRFARRCRPPPESNLFPSGTCNLYECILALLAGPHSSDVNLVCRSCAMLERSNF